MAITLPDLGFTRIGRGPGWRHEAKGVCVYLIGAYWRAYRAPFPMAEAVLRRPDSKPQRHREAVSAALKALKAGGPEDWAPDPDCPQEELQAYYAGYTDGFYRHGQHEPAEHAATYLRGYWAGEFARVPCAPKEA